MSQGESLSGHLKVVCISFLSFGSPPPPSFLVVFFYLKKKKFWVLFLLDMYDAFVLVFSVHISEYFLRISCHKWNLEL